MDLAVALEVIRGPLPETLPRLSAVLAESIPHMGVARLSANCPYAPFMTFGKSPGGPGSAVRTTDVAALRSVVPPGTGWQGRAQMAGVEAPVVAFSSAATERGDLLVLLRSDDSALEERHLAAAQNLWDLLTAQREALRAEAIPGSLTISRAAAAARAAAIAELEDAHGAVLTSLLGVLRDQGIDDASARRRAVDLTLTALAEVRLRAELDQALVEERAADAFGRLAESLRRILRARGLRLDLVPPGAEDGAKVLLPGDVASIARAAVRAVVQAAVDESGDERVQRLHVSWKAHEGTLRATVRDDGPGTLTRSALEARHVYARLAPLGGNVEIDAVPGWGTTVNLDIPLGPPEIADKDPLSALGEREVQVLGELALGRRNRQIAQELHITESTVKFHVTNILTKLGVSTRGEAAALAHERAAR